MKTYNLIGIDGNAHAIMGYVSNAMKENGYSKDEISSYMEAAKMGSYGQLLSISQRYINVINAKNNPL